MLTVDANVWVAAFDPRDRFHTASKTFLRAAGRQGLGFYGPTFVTLEVACALSRRAGDPTVGTVVEERLRVNPVLTLHSLDESFLGVAREIGVRKLLRGADALYAAAAEIYGAPLVSWDSELLKRAGAVTPDQWLTAQP